MTDEAVEAAAQALYQLANRDMFAKDWTHLPEGRREGWRVMARTALDAAQQTELCEESR
jgi:hypothetical protein